MGHAHNGDSASGGKGFEPTNQSTRMLYAVRIEWTTVSRTQASIDWIDDHQPRFLSEAKDSFELTQVGKEVKLSRSQRIPYTFDDVHTVEVSVGSFEPRANSVRRPPR